MITWITQYEKWACKQINGSALCFFRFVFGMFISATALKLIIHLPYYFINPVVQLKYPMLNDWPHFSEMGNLALCYLLVMAGLGLMLGIWVQSASLLLIGVCTQFFLQDASFLHNYLALSVVLAIPFLFFKTDGYFSWQTSEKTNSQKSFRNGRFQNLKETNQTIPRYQHLLYVAIFYLGYIASGLEKLRKDWLSGKILDVNLGLGSETSALAESFFHMNSSAIIANWMIAIEFWVPIGMSIQRLRRPTFVLLCILHLFQITVLRGGSFCLLMMMGSILYFEPDWPEVFFKRIFKRLFPSKMKINFT